LTLKEDINSGIKEAMKAGDKTRLSILRMILSSITYKEKELKTDNLSDSDVLKIISTSAKQHIDSIEQFKKGNRTDLAEKEEAELKILEEMLPAKMSEEDVRKVVEEVKTETGASDMKDMGALMKAVMAKLQGQADGKMVNNLVKEVLS